MVNVIKLVSNLSGKINKIGEDVVKFFKEVSSSNEALSSCKKKLNDVLAGQLSDCMSKTIESKIAQAVIKDESKTPPVYQNTYICLTINIELLARLFIE